MNFVNDACPRVSCDYEEDPRLPLSDPMSPHPRFHWSCCAHGSGRASYAPWLFVTACLNHSGSSCMLESTPARNSGLLVRHHASRSPRHFRMSSSSTNHQWTSRSTATAPADLRGAAAVPPSALGMVLGCCLEGRAPRSERSWGCHTRVESPVSSTATGPADLRGAAAVPPSALGMVLGCCLGGRAPRSERSWGRSGAEESSVRGCHGPSQRDVTRGTMAFSSVAAPLPRPLPHASVAG